MERRIGSRHEVQRDVVHWRTGEPPRGLMGRLRSVPGGELLLDNLSVTGAGFIGPASCAFRVGMRIEIEIGGCWGLVQVARVRDGSTPDQKLYGVAFVTMEPVFMEQVSARLPVSEGAARGMGWL